MDLVRVRVRVRVRVGLGLGLTLTLTLTLTRGARDRLDLSGKCIVAAILLTSIANRTSAIGLGLVAAAVTSHLRVSRLNALKYHVTGRSYHPQASRPLAVQVAISLTLTLTLTLALTPTLT